MFIKFNFTFLCQVSLIIKQFFQKGRQYHLNKIIAEPQTPGIGFQTAHILARPVTNLL